MFFINDQISLSIKNEQFSVEYTDKNGQQSTCFTDSTSGHNGIIGYLAHARSWFVCTFAQESFSQRHNDIIQALDEACYFIGGENYCNNGLSSGTLLKNFIVEVNKKKYSCECNIQWRSHVYQELNTDILYKPVFRWSLLENIKESSQYTKKSLTMPTFTKNMDFGEIFSQDWKRFLNNRVLEDFIKDMIQYAN